MLNPTPAEFPGALLEPRPSTAVRRGVIVISLTRKERVPLGVFWPDSAPDRPGCMNKILSTTDHRPWPLPKSPWVMTQRWNDLLFAHWPLPAAELSHLIPNGLSIDVYDGSAWVGVVPFWMDQVRVRGLPPVPGANRFPELNLSPARPSVV